MDTLELIKKLRTALGDGSSSEAVWDLVRHIESSVETDSRAPKIEREQVERLKSTVTDLIAARCDGLNADAGRVSVVLTGLEGSLKRRTTGPDGWKLA